MVTADLAAKVISVLNEMTQEWELDDVEKIDLNTGLMGDLAFESIDVVQLAVTLEEHFEANGLPFEGLFMRDGDYVDEILVSDVVKFLQENLA